MKKERKLKPIKNRREEQQKIDEKERKTAAGMYTKCMYTKH